MTFWKADDRQGAKLFTERPTYCNIHDMWVGKRAKRTPRKGDRVIVRFIRIVQDFPWKR